MPVNPQLSGDVILYTRIFLIVKTIQRSTYDCVQLHGEQQHATVCDNAVLNR